METGGSPQSTKTANKKSMLRTVVLACGMAVLSYLSAKLFGSALISAQADWPLWLGNVLLVSVLVLVPRRTWPILMAAALAANVLYDLQTGLTIRTTSVLILGDTLEVLTAAFCLTYFFDGVPRLDSVRALAKFSFFAVFLTPLTGASVGAFAESSDYWTNWRISFFSDAIVYLTLLPAILGWVTKAPAGTRRARAHYLEAAALFAALIFFGYLTFVGPERISPQTLFYSLVPFLLWSALRFGSTGVSTSVIVIAFLAIWGVTHGRGPFIEPGPLNNVSSLQVFLFFTASPFMVLAALVTERRRTIEALRESEARERARVKELETLLDAAPIPILIARDAECKYVTANRAGYQLYCLPIGANFSRNVSAIETPPFRMVRDGVEIATEELPLQRAAATGMPVFGSSFTLLLKEGTEHHMIGNAVPLFGEDGKARGAIGAFVDITDRKQAEDRLRLVINTIPGLLWSALPDGSRDFLSQPWLDYSGLSLDEALGWGWMVAIHPEDRATYMHVWRTALAVGQPFEHETRFRRADGEYRWFLTRAVPLWDERGNIAKWYATTNDIEDRKRAEMQSRALIEAIPQQIWTSPPDGKIDYCNELWRSYMGLELEELQVDGLQSILHPDVRERVIRAWQEAVTNGTPYEQEVRSRGADGQYRWFLARGVPLRDAGGRIVRWYGTNTDIEDLKRAEDAHRQIEEQHRIVVETATDAVVGIDEDSQILFVNPATTLIFGYESSELVGQSLTMLMPEFIRKLHKAGLKRYLTTGQRHIKWQGTELVGLRKNGEEFPVDVSFGEVNKEGRHIFTGFLRDIGERKRAEEELRRLSGQLLRLQDEERRRIARDLHDSTGQDLVALATMLSQLRVSIPSGERKSRRLHSECKALADHCVREVRTLSYLLHPPVLDQAGLDDAIRDYVQGFTTRSGIQVELELSPCLERMARDVELALFRVVQEGLTNIQRHSGSQRAKIRIHRNSGFTLEISDLGSGVSAGVHRRNEEPRFQVGVGIPSMQERVKLIGGRLDIDSTNHGTTVRVTMPLGGERT
jgi:PAS domain S-box-containing protein